MERPKTTWKARRNNANKEAGGPVWLSCSVCGKENLVFASSIGSEGYVCNACRKNDESAVSMRCLRHKKRFNVPKWWTDVCGHLCPKCYEKLSPDERARYEPKQGSDISTREAEKGKDIVYPSMKEEEYIQKTECLEVEDERRDDSVCEFCSQEEEYTRESIIKQEAKEFKARIEDWESLKQEETKSSAADNPNLAWLLPRYKIHCQKCGTSYPCNYTWFENSTVLCPSCYGQMSDFEIQEFHKLHQADKPKYRKEESPPQPPIKSVRLPVFQQQHGWVRQSNLVNSGGYWSSSRIMRATRSELIEAARLGIVSKARMRIELDRRAHYEYYDMLSEEVGVKPIPMY